MLKNFQLIHRRKPATINGSLLVWETCLRSIGFGAGDGREPQDEIFEGAAAYRFLLEVICGLHSPVVGETEVFGQFKNFSKLWLEQEPQRAALVQKLFMEAKELRSKHLRGLGTQSYGGWIKRQLKESQVHVFGGGQLVEEILPYLQKSAEKVTLHVRQPIKAAHLNVEVKDLAERAFDRGALIIAAPVKAQDIEQWLKHQPAQVFDLRDDSHVDRLTTSPKHHVLQDIFHEIEHTRARLLPVIRDLKAEIHARAEKVANQVHVRPQGWDDICA